MELDQEIYEKATSPNQELDILITLCDAPALEEIRFGRIEASATSLNSLTTP